MTPPSSPSPEPSVLASFLKLTRSASSILFTAVRKVPVLVVCVLVLAVLYYRNPSQFQDTAPAEPAQASVAAEPQLDAIVGAWLQNGKKEPAQASVAAEPQPPPELTVGQQALWLCVQRVDSHLTGGVWSDIYYGMEATLDGTAVTVKVTEKWKTLSESRQKDLAQLLVDTWLKTGQTLQVLRTSQETPAVLIQASGEPFREIVIQRLPDEQTVAAWKPATGVQLFDPQTDV